MSLLGYEGTTRQKTAAVAKEGLTHSNTNHPVATNNHATTNGSGVASKSADTGYDCTG